MNYLHALVTVSELGKGPGQAYHGFKVEPSLYTLLSNTVQRIMRVRCSQKNKLNGHWFSSMVSGLKRLDVPASNIAFALVGGHFPER